MKHITLELDESILELADALLAQQEVPEEPQVVSLFDGEDPPTLHDLFDVSLPGPFPDFSPDVELLFPTSVVEEAERQNEEVRCETPVVEVELECNESMISTTPEGSVGTPEEEESEAGPSSRWGPLEPGDSPRPCRACTYHRIESGDPTVKCSLCYMKDTYYQVYSKYILKILFCVVCEKILFESAV
uniref:E1A n=1 Tax=Bat mastadenovirus TaxID=740971 RepID=A0A8G0RD88_9ADEN|nr:E1A [Bat mastadenovirus]